MPKHTSFTYKTQADDDGIRLDTILARRPQICSRSFAQRLIKEGLVQIDSQQLNKSFKANVGQIITYQVPDPQEAELEPQNIELEIIYEDRDLAVINKAAGMVVHPSYGHWEGTLVNALLYHLKGLSAIGGVKRPGIVHRLDKDTSGLMLVAKNDRAHIALSQAIKERQVERKYLALVQGDFNEKVFSIEAPIARDPVNRKKMAVISNGRYSKTNARVIKRFPKYSLLQLSLITGRTHQIRVHLSYINHPVIADEVYGRLSSGKELGLERHFLHAFFLHFFHPVSGEQLEFEASLPEDLQSALNNIKE